MIRPALADKLRALRKKLHGDFTNAVLPVAGWALTRGLPSRTELLRSLIAHVNDGEERAGLEHDLSNGEVQEVARDVELLVPRSLVADAIKAAYQRPSAGAPPIYDVIASLPTSHVATTCYDPWLKDAMSKAKGGTPRVYTPFDPGAFSDLGPGGAPLGWSGGSWMPG